MLKAATVTTGELAYVCVRVSELPKAF